MDVGLVDRFIAAVRRVEQPSPGGSTSVRRHPAVAEALTIAGQLGHGTSVNAIAEGAVADHLLRLAHEMAVEAHLTLFPEDRPSPADLARVRLQRDGQDVDQATLGRAERLLRTRLDREPTVEELVAAAVVLDAGMAA